MSVINKMLRDLDASQRSGQSAALADPALRDVLHGTVSLAPDPSGRASHTGGSVRGLLVVLGVGVIFAIGWYWRDTVTPHAPSSAVTVVPPTQAQILMPVAQPATSEQVTAIAPIVVPVSGSHVTHGAPPPAVVDPSTALRQGAAQREGTTAIQNAPTSNVASATAPARAQTVATASASPVPIGSPSRGQVAMDVVAESQALWERGSREAAIRLLRQKVDAADGLALAGGSQDVMWLWVRELTRMEMSEGLLAQALERLIRLEPMLAGQPVAWAMRANIAQRLGHHAESANAYLAALRLRPDEGRWMLGAAVSLAADGQTARASEYAAKAQEHGAMNADVAAFLRQQGVTVR